MKSATLLRLNVREVLAANCTGMDDHDSPECDKCENMEDAIIEAVQNWRIRAYKTTKGKI